MKYFSLFGAIGAVVNAFSLFQISFMAGLGWFITACYLFIAYYDSIKPEKADKAQE